MNPLPSKRLAKPIFAGFLILTVNLVALAQTTGPATPTPAKPATPPKPAAAPIHQPAPPVRTAATQPATANQPLSFANNGSVPANSPQSRQPAPAAPTAPANQQRAAIPSTGIGDFHSSGFTLTTYGCYRSGERVLCDFDFSGAQNREVVSGWSANLFRPTIVVGGGRMAGYNNTYFVGDDASPFTSAYISPGSPLRLIVEYESVPANYSSVSLVSGATRLTNIPISTVDTSQTGGKIPARSAPVAQAQNQPVSQPGVAPQGQAAPARNAQSQTGNAGNALDQTSQTINGVNAQKKKASSLWKQVQSTLKSQ